MENQRLRERFAVTGTFFTFFGLFFMFFREVFEGLNQTALISWGGYIGVACLVVAALAFVAVVYIDETRSYENEHPRLSK